MGTKSLTITNEAYEKLAVLKESKESFSDVINRITKKYSVLDLVGLLSDKEAKEMKEHIKELRKHMGENMNERFKRLE